MTYFVGLGTFQVCRRRSVGGVLETLPGFVFAVVGETEENTTSGLFTAGGVTFWHAQLDKS